MRRDAAVSPSCGQEDGSEERFHVTMTFREGGPAVEGTWTDAGVTLNAGLPLSLRRLPGALGSFGRLPLPAFLAGRPPPRPPVAVEGQPRYGRKG